MILKPRACFHPLAANPREYVGVNCSYTADISSITAIMFIYATLLVFVLSSTVIATETKSEPRAILHNKNTILTNYYYYRILGEDSNRPIYDNQAIRFKKAEDGSGVEAVAHFDIKNSESTLEVSGQNSGLLCYDNSLAMKKGSRTVRKLLVDLNKDEKTLDLEGLWGRQVDGKVGEFAHSPQLLTAPCTEQRQGSRSGYHVRGSSGPPHK